MARPHPPLPSPVAGQIVMLTVHRISPARSCPTITLLDPPAGLPQRWVRGGDLPQDAVRATIDRRAGPLEFCKLTPGTLVLPSDALDGEIGASAMYYTLWHGMEQVHLDVEGRSFTCFIPTMSLRLDADPKFPSANVFRIEGRDPAEIFFSSSVVPSGADELDHLYDAGGFEGLTFELVWTQPGPWNLTGPEIP